MRNFLPKRSHFRTFIVRSFIATGLCVCASSALPAPVLVHYRAGTIHAFLEMRSEDGHVVASGDLVQVANGDRITSRTTFHFTDGSVDDDTTVLSQRHSLSLISDHHVQKGPFFPHPMDVLIDSGKGLVTVRSTGKDGKDEVKTEHLKLPPDLANGMVPFVIENMQPTAPETTVSMLVFTPKPRVVKLAIARQGEEPFSVVGTSHQGIRYEIKIELGGVAGVVAPLIGKQPPNIQLWIIGGQAPTFVKEQGPIYADGPILTIELARPVWPDSPKASE
jgi:hypothetical protein